MKHTYLGHVIDIHLTSIYYYMKILLYETYISRPCYKYSLNKYILLYENVTLERYWYIHYIVMRRLYGSLHI